MNITVNALNLSEQIIEVNQFDHNAATVTAVFPSPFRGVSLTDLTACILISQGDMIISGDELTIGTGESNKSVIWTVSERYTQRAGTFFVQFAFSDSLGNVKVYSDRCIFRVKPSVDYTSDFLRYNPTFIDRLWAEINLAIANGKPTNLSELENDVGFISGDFRPEDLVTKNDLTAALGQVSGTKKWRRINRFTVPETAAGSINHVTFSPDTADRYTHDFFLNRDSNGMPFSLSDVSVFFKQTSSSEQRLINLFVYANSPLETSGGTALFTSPEFITTGSGRKNEVHLSRSRDRWHVEALCQSGVNLSSHTSYARFSTENLGDRNISSLRTVLESTGTSYSGMTGGIEVDIWGVDA